jgi:hypothetical protein
MSHDDKGHEELVASFEGRGVKLHVAARGRLTIAIVALLSLFVISSHLWANNVNPESVKILEENSFPVLNLPIYDILEK